MHFGKGDLKVQAACKKRKNRQDKPFSVSLYQKEYLKKGFLEATGRSKSDSKSNLFNFNYI